MKRYYIIAFTHRSTGLKNLESLFTDETVLTERLEKIKKEFGAEGLMYLSTCNRIEFIFSISGTVAADAVKKLLAILHPEWSPKKTDWALNHVWQFKGEAAVKHLFEVASSLDSLVVGEREIITQVRSAYEWSHENKLTDDFIRVVMRKTIETAKRIYTDTKIAEKPVSVMSLACRKMQEWHVGFSSRVLMLGAGQTADVMVNYLSKHGFKKLVVINRTLKHANELAAKHKGIETHSLQDIESYDKGFDVLITCVRTQKPIISSRLFTKLLAGEQGEKIVIDMGLPPNVANKVLAQGNVKSVTIKDLEDMARLNMEARKTEIAAAGVIIKNAIHEFYGDLHNRKIERAMHGVPQRIQQIKEKAMTSVFSKEIETLEPASKEVLKKVVDYMEKKYISIPMQLAKEIWTNFEQ